MVQIIIDQDAWTRNEWARWGLILTELRDIAISAPGGGGTGFPWRRARYSRANCGVLVGDGIFHRHNVVDHWARRF